MAQPGNHFNEGPGSSASGNSASKSSGSRAEMNQLDFELDFYRGLLEQSPDYVDVLRVYGNLLSLKGLFADGLKIDKRLVRLRPRDPLAHYNLACSYALMKRADQSLKTLRRAVELGYRDFRFMCEDNDLQSVRQDPRFRQLLREYEDA